MQLARLIDGRKFMWDGAAYREEAEAVSMMQKYEQDGFETRMFQEEDKFYLFTRRSGAEAKAAS